MTAQFYPTYLKVWIISVSITFLIQSFHYKRLICWNFSLFCDTCGINLFYLEVEMKGIGFYGNIFSISNIKESINYHHFTILLKFFNVCCNIVMLQCTLIIFTIVPLDLRKLLKTLHSKLCLIQSDRKVITN